MNEYWPKDMNVRHNYYLIKTKNNKIFDKFSVNKIKSQVTKCNK